MNQVVVLVGVITILAVMVVIVTRAVRAQRGPGRRRTGTSEDGVGEDLQPFAERLGRSAWGMKGEARGLDFVLEVAAVQSARSPAETVGILLAHARKVAPDLYVPFLTPRVVVGPLASNAAGLFSEEDGWVTITVSQSFFADHAAACAILCHELAHYVLNASGIREATLIANERLTDVAMFVLGLGDVFLAGYKRAPTAYRTGHTLGYLSDSEYRFLDKEVFDLWVSGRLQRTHLELDAGRLRAAIPDAGVRARLLEAERKKRPEATDGELIQHVIDRYQADRR